MTSPSETTDKNNNNNNNNEVYDLHPIEEIAHSLLSGSLDNLNENFELLDQSQLILLTRLKIIEERLQGYQKIAFEDSKIREEELVTYMNKIKDLEKRLQVTLKTMTKIDDRIAKMENRL
ncbi:uncharacterized protein RJT21DRAFT_114419 [Scheffersomyces amazonensis]|uniref:uncharacterized protein n=1 Tax=Scheffersomyces amazonensis TaxID=1078765 RepID=UPI00315C8F94